MRKDSFFNLKNNPRGTCTSGVVILCLYFKSASYLALPALQALLLFRLHQDHLPA